jgi:hypothetical protein
MFAALNSFQVGGKPTFVSDVFSTYLYTGNGSTQTITNGIDLSNRDGLVWIKQRNSTGFHRLLDTLRGVNRPLFSNSTNSSPTQTELQSFNATGFTVTGANTNAAFNYVSWTFRKQQKFFDVVTYTGNGSTGLQIPHNLGSVPGCIMIKRTDSTSAWAVYHRMLNGGSGPEDYKIFLNTTAAQAGSSPYIVSSVSSTNFTLGGDGSGGGSTLTNVNGATYVAYIFAHNAGGFGQTGTDNVITCGGYTTDGDGNATINLGYVPQWLLVKNTSAPASWVLVDNARGFGSTVDSTNRLVPDTSEVEVVGSTPYYVTSNGFTAASGPSVNFIYVAIKAS